MIAIGEKDLTLDNIESLLYGGKSVALPLRVLKRTEKSFLFLKDFSKDKLIYGINTGFGPMAQYVIEERHLLQLQYNLIRSHCSGTGALLSALEVKALMIARLASLMRGYSGVHQSLLVALRDMINKGVYPCIFEHGGVGASGDLVQLAHLALVLIGEGEVMYKGRTMPTKMAFAKANIKPARIHKREGIAVLNGTSAMTGIALINVLSARRLINVSVALSSLISELVEAFDDHLSAELNSLKPHAGQNKVAAAMWSVARRSQRIRKRTDHLYNEKFLDNDILSEKVQEYYSLRCVPQILGPVLDTIEYAEKVVLAELNSVNDNPVIDVKNRNVFHGGNFHGDYVSLEMDKLKIAVTKMAMLAERQLNFLLNDKLNQKLPPFINLGRLGLNYGSQGMQFTATSTVAECQTLSMPAYIHSIPNNNDNQDVVSMGTNAALIAKKVLNNSFEVMAIHAIAIVQAVDYLKCDKQLSPVTQSLYADLRRICPKFSEDRPLYRQIGAVTGYLKSGNINLV